MKKKLTTMDLCLCGLFAALIAIGAFLRIVIPLEPMSMNFTLQWLFVLLAGYLLGGKLSMLSVGAYLLVGLAGFPVFARGGGITYVLRPTFGFLLGFLFAAPVIGFLSEKQPKRWIPLSLCGIAGLVVYYLIGFVYYYFGMDLLAHTPQTLVASFVSCFITFPEDLLLVLLAAYLAGRLYPVLKGIRKA